MPVSQHDSQSPSSDAADSLPRFAIGHMVMQADDVQRLTDFYVTIGLRRVIDMERMAIVELRGGTHIVIRSGQPGQAQFDFIVDDIDETHEVMTGAGANPTPIKRGNPHDSFSARDPEGNELTIHSTHAIGPV